VYRRAPAGFTFMAGDHYPPGAAFIEDVRATFRKLR
jgi:hypothetical protein